MKSIRNIEKITKTMKIVASTKLNKAQRAMTESRSYGQTSNTVFEKAETKAGAEDKKTLIVVAVPTRVSAVVSILASRERLVEC